jgi:transposase
MLLTIQNILRNLLYERGKINEQEVAIIFEAPTRERLERLWQPAVSLFLYAIHENVELRQSSYRTVAADNGRAERRPLPRRFDLRYMVSAISSEVEDEQQLLWRVLTTLVRYPQVPEELLPAELRALAVPLVSKLAQEDDSGQLIALWNSLGSPPRPALAYTLTVPVELALVAEAPLVLRRVARYHRHLPGEGERQAVERGLVLGGVVRNEQGQALAGVRVALEGHAEEGVTDSAGRFVLGHLPPQRAVLRLTPPVGPARRLTLDYGDDSSPAVDQPGARGSLSYYEIVLERLPALET